MRMIASAAALIVGLLAAGCNGEVVGGGQKPAQLLVVSGDLQTGTVGKELAAPLVVRVVDERARPIEGQIVNFRVTAGNGTVFAGAALTDKDGQARERWVLGTVAGDTQRVEARAVDPATGEALVFAVFRAVGTPDVAAAISAAGASSFTGLPTLPLADSVAVFVRDVYGNPIPGQTVAWTVKQGGGSTSPATAVTGANGVARTQWTLGPQYEGAQVLEAAAGLTLTTQFTANVQIPAGAVMAKISGDAQTGTAGLLLDQPLVARVQRADGTPIPGIPVTFTLPPLYGSVSPATAVSDADGRVSVRWTLGTFAGGLQLEAAIPTGSTVTFTATSRPGPVAALLKVSGDGQQGRAGSVLADSLVVRAVDVYGNAVPGTAVTWSAASGSVSPASVVADANGRAATSYTLPAAGGPVTVQASAASLPAVSFGLTAVFSPVYMRILQPTPNAVRGDNLQVLVVIDSANASIASVQASAAGRTVALTPASTGGLAGTLSLAGTPVGPMELRVLATTVNGDTAAVTRTFIHDAPPTLSITAPPGGQVARPQLRIDADCADDGPEGCASLTVTAFTLEGPYQQVASGTSGVHTSVSLAALDGYRVLLRFTGTDSRNQTASVVDTVYVETSAALTEVASAGVRLLDADVGRVLYADAAGSVWLRAGASETLLAAAVHPAIGRLHPYGAIFGQAANLYDWNRGTLHDLGRSSAQLDVDGAWAIWANFHNGKHELYRRDLNAAATATIHQNAINNGNDVTSAGVVVFGSSADPDPADSYEIFRYDGSGLTRLTSDPDGAYRNLYPVTDGTSVLYSKQSPTSPQHVGLWRNGSETMMPSNGGYAVNAGWIAWTAPDAGGINQIRVRAPDGTERLATSGGTSGTLYTLGPDGTVVYANGGWMYAIRAPYSGAPTRIAHEWRGIANVRFVGADLMLFLGRTVFRVNY
jgi:hypothetical protein